MAFIDLVSTPSISVKQYGAVGDGVTDDSAAIAQTLSIAQSSGAQVWFPPSTGAYITSTITGFAGMSLLGNNNGNFSQNVPFANRSVLKLKPGTNGPLIDIPANISNIRLRDLELDGNSANQTGGANSGVVHFEDNLTVGDESQAIIERCSIHHGYGHNIYLGKGRRGNFVRDNLITWSLNGDGILVATSDSTISGGFIGDSGRNGIGVGSTNTQLYSSSGNSAAVTIIDGIGIFKSGTTQPGAAIAVSAFSSSTMISNCGMDRNNYNAVSIYDGSTTKIVNCSFHSNYASANNAGSHIDLASGVVKVALDDNSFGPQDGDTPNKTSYAVSVASSSTQIYGNIGVQDSTDSVRGLISNSANWIGWTGQTAFFNVKQYGAVGDGVTDDTAAIQACINAAVNNSLDGTNQRGGIVFFPWTGGNTYLVTGLTIYNSVHLMGVGPTTLKLANGANADVIQTYNAATLIGGSSTGGIYGWSISNLIIDGNKSNQTATSYGLRTYGYGYYLQNVRIRNAYSDAFYSDWNGGASSPGNDSMESSIIGCKFHDCNGIGVNFHGPHDSQFLNCISYKTGSHAFYIGPNAGGVQFTSCHGWGMATGVNAVSWLIESQANCINCEAEGSDSVQVVLLANGLVWSGGRMFANGTLASSASGLQIGQTAGATPYPGSAYQSAGLTTSISPSGYFIDSKWNNCEGPNGSIWFNNDGGKGFIRGPVVLNSGDGNTNIVALGSPRGDTQVHLIPAGTVPTADGTMAKGGRIKYSANSNNAFVIGDMTNDVFNINTFNKRAEFPNNTLLRLYSDNYSTRTVELSNGTLSLLQSATAAAVTTGGTITTSGVGIARVAPTAAVTGVILQAGTNAGQMVHVINESAFSVTFATSATSHVAQGTSAVVQANGRLSFCWDSATSLWY